MLLYRPGESVNSTGMLGMVKLSAMHRMAQRGKRLSFAMVMIDS